MSVNVTDAGARRAVNVRNVQLPAAMGTITSLPRAPKVMSTSDGILVSHSCLLSKITSNATANTFTTLYSVINPGLPSGTNNVDQGVFSWIQNIANNYQRYIIRKLKFRYQPICGTSTTGIAAMAVLYDTKDTIPTSLSGFLSLFRATSGPMWSNLSVDGVVSGRMSQPQNGRFVRLAAVPAGTSADDYDFGRLVIATDGAASSTLAGMVWVDVELECFLPLA
jgi:hypothetical protein